MAGYGCLLRLRCPRPCCSMSAPAGPQPLFPLWPTVAELVWRLRWSRRTGIGRRRLGITPYPPSGLFGLAAFQHCRMTAPALALPDLLNFGRLLSLGAHVMVLLTIPGLTLGWIRTS